MTFVMDKNGLQSQRNLPYFTEIQEDISDLPFFRKKNHKYQAYKLDILR